jgi:hypothetical protein
MPAVGWGGAGMIGIGGGVDMICIGGGADMPAVGGRTVVELMRQQLTGGYSPYVGMFLGEDTMTDMVNRGSYCLPTEQWVYNLRNAPAMNEPTRLKKLSFLKEMEEHHAAEGQKFGEGFQTMINQMHEKVHAVKAEQILVRVEQVQAGNASIYTAKEEGQVIMDRSDAVLQDEYDKKHEVLKNELATKRKMQHKKRTEHSDYVRKVVVDGINELDCGHTTTINQILDHAIDAIHKKRKTNEQISIASADTLSRQQQALFNDS